MSKRKVGLYLQDIIASVEKIAGFIGTLSFEDFCNDEKTVDAVVRKLEIIGEASKNIPLEIKRNNPEIPWKGIIGMRNKINHEYFGVDLEILWKTVKEDLPILKKQISRLTR